MGKKESHAGQRSISSSAEDILLVLLYRLHAIEKGEGSAKEEDVEAMEDLEAEDEEEDMRLRAWGSSKVLVGVLVLDSGSSCHGKSESPQW